mmetsp:Transcript_24455/g.57803  ORF Transcript_24455/g.57803 Transcript_24455/m.57803 type:complete len:299 (+) Transcript_24455:443-1339(+)
MISFHESVETLFTGIFGCGRVCDNADFTDLDDCKENQNGVMNQFNKRDTFCDSKKVIPRDENNSFLNETSSTSRNSFVSESSSSYSDDNTTDVRIRKFPLQPRQEPPQVRLQQREFMVVPPNGAIRNWSPVIPLPVLATTKEKQQTQLPVSPLLPPKIQRLTLDYAPAFSRYPSHMLYNEPTKMTPAGSTSSQGVLYDIDGLPMDVPEPFARSRSLDFLFSFRSPPSFSKKNERNRNLSILEENSNHQCEPCHMHYEANSQYQQRGMVEDTSTHLYPFKNRKQEEEVLSNIKNTYVPL